jgi:hypothetical protein
MWPTLAVRGYVDVCRGDLSAAAEEPSSVEHLSAVHPRRLRTWLFVVALSLASGPLYAQTAVDAPRFGHGTTVAIAAGAASEGGRLGAVAAGTIGWEVDSRATVVSTFCWLDRGASGDAFAGAFALDVTLLPARVAAPFVEGGFGLYRAFYDLSTAAVPGFYRDRRDANNTAGVLATFTDPMILIGAGVNVFATPHFAIRPQVEAFVVVHGSQRYVAAAFTVRAAYTLERHPFR